MWKERKRYAFECGTHLKVVEGPKFLRLKIVGCLSSVTSGRRIVL